MSIPDAEGASPAMAQWFALKAAHAEALLFFRMGDFYELFFADAEAAAAALDIALTARGSHNGAPIPMCGVPAASAEPYLARLLRRGFRVAIAEQMEPASGPSRAAAKAPIPRAVVRTLSPGTVTEEALLEAGRANLLLALARAEGALGAAWLDVSTGLFETETLAESGLGALLARLDPAEVLAPAGLDLGDWSGPRVPDADDPPVEEARRRLSEHFNVASLAAFGSFSAAEVLAAWRAVDYLIRGEAGRTPRLSHPVPQGEGRVLAMDQATRASLDILRGRDGSEASCLLGAIRRTVSAAGARMLASFLAAPLTEAEAIAERQEGWRWFAGAAGAAEIRAALKSSPDLARALARLSLARFAPRDLAAVRDSLTVAGACAVRFAEPMPPLLRRLHSALAAPPGLAELLAAALAEMLPARLEDGGVIARGYDPALDEARNLRDDSRRTLAGMEKSYAARFGVSGLRIRHHAQLGYVIEVPAAAAERLRTEPDLVLRQGLASSARFSTADLADLDRRIAEAGERAAARERALAAELAQRILAHAPALAALAEALAELDVLQGAAALTASGEWCRPDVTDGLDFRILAGRHPVVEAALAGRARFVPNDCDLSPDRRLALLTGPNMAGKSTYLRQNALIVILAQAGLPVPAREAEIGIVDRLFSRVGAADDLARGQSTFMVEMTETAAILHQAGPRSLVIVDEIGRGTATLDGLAIAWAVLEALHHQIRARTLFATHFHELARLGPELPHLAPHTMRVREWKGSVVFLHEVAAGAAGRSFGVHVAGLAGVPEPVVRRAASLLAVLERQGALSMAAELPLFAAAADPPASSPPPPSPAPPPEPDGLRERLASLDPDCLTPREALKILYDLQAMAGRSRASHPVESS